MNSKSLVTLLISSAAMASATCDCSTILYAKDVEPYYTPITDSGEYVSRVGVPMPLADSNEPIAEGIPDVRGTYLLPFPPPTAAKFVEVAQAGNRVQLRVPRAGTLDGSIARDFILDGEGRNGLFADFLNVGTAGANDEPTLIQTVRSPTDATFTVRRFSDPNTNETFGLGNFPNMNPATAAQMPFLEAFFISQILPLGPNEPPYFNAVPFIRTGPAPAAQYVTQECFDSCPAPAPADDREVVDCDSGSGESSHSKGSGGESSHSKGSGSHSKGSGSHSKGKGKGKGGGGHDPATQRCFGSHADDFPLQYTPCADAVITPPADGDLNGVIIDQNCGYKLDDPNPVVPLALDGCRVHLPSDRPDLRGTYVLEDDTELRIEQCGDRIVLLFDNDFVFDARTARDSDNSDTRRNTGAFGFEPSTHSTDKFRAAAYLLTVTPDSFDYQSIARADVQKHVRRVSRHEIELEYYDFAEQKMVTLRGSEAHSSSGRSSSD